MAGFFDQLLRKEANPKFTGRDMATMFIPLAGPYLAMANAMRKKKQAEDEVDKNTDYMFSDPAELDPLGQRVQQRMLERSGGNITTPGFMANTMMAQEGRNFPNNPGNAAAATASRLMGAGFPEEGVRLAQVANKELQTPWKPSETESVKPKRDPDTNLYVDQNGKFLPNQKVPAKVEEVVGEEMLEGYKWNTTDAEGNFIPGDWVAPPAKGSRYQSKTDVRVGGTDLSPLAKLIGQDSVEKRGEEYLANLRSFDDSITTYDDLINLTEKNPSGGIAGLSGGASRLVDQGINAAEFIASKTRVNEQGQTEAEVIGKYNSALAGLANRIFPESVRRDATLANSLIIQLAYELARMNNMGTAGGGRGITDADMRYALQQLASGAATSNFANVLKYQRQRLVQRYEREKSIAKDTFGDNTQHLYPSLTKSIDERMYRKPGAVSPGGTQDDPLGILK